MRSSRNSRFYRVSRGIRSLYSTIRAPNDYYSTPPCAVHRLFEKVKFTDVWECACGEGVMSDAIAEHGVLSFSSDKYDYGYGEVLDFLSYTGVWHGDIVTNPPFCLCIDFIDKGYSLLEEGRHMALFLPLRYLEGCQRKKCFERCPLKAVFVSVGRLGCFNNGNCANSCRSAICYAWFLWEKGYSGSIVLDWL